MAKEIHTIFEQDTNGGTGVLGIDDDTKLYWNGKPVAMEQTVRLTTWVNVSVVLTGAATVVIAIFTALQYYK